MNKRMWTLSEVFGTSVFEREALRQKHVEHRCDFDECPYCLVASKNAPELTSEMIEVVDPSLEI